MVWEKIDVGNFLDLRKQYDAKTSYHQIITLKDNSVHLSGLLFEHVQSVDLHFYELSDYIYEVPDGELSIGIKNNTDVFYFSRLYASSYSSEHRKTLYFRNNEPSHFKYDGFSGPGWPVNKAPLYDLHHLLYVEKLKLLVPDARQNIALCLDMVMQPGETFGKEDGIVVKLPKK